MRLAEARTVAGRLLTPFVVLTERATPRDIRTSAVEFLRSVRKGVWFGADPVIVYASWMGGPTFGVAQEPPRHKPWTTIRVGANNREVARVADELVAMIDAIPAAQRHRGPRMRIKDKPPEYMHELGEARSPSRNFRINTDEYYADVLHVGTGAELARVIKGHAPYLIRELEALDIDWSTATVSSLQRHKDELLPIMRLYNEFQRKDVLTNSRSDRKRWMAIVKKRAAKLRDGGGS